MLAHLKINFETVRSKLCNCENFDDLIFENFDDVPAAIQDQGPDVRASCWVSSPPTGFLALMLVGRECAMVVWESCSVITNYNLGKGLKKRFF